MEPVCRWEDRVLPAREGPFGAGVCQHITKMLAAGNGVPWRMAMRVIPSSVDRCVAPTPPEVA